MKQTVATLAEMKKAGRKACMVPAYHYTMARLESAADGGREAEIDGSHAELLGRYGAVTDAIRGLPGAPALTMTDDDVMEFLPEEE